MKKRFAFHSLLLASLAVLALSAVIYVDRTFHAYAQTGVNFVIQTVDLQTVDASQFPVVNSITISDRNGVSKIVFLHKVTSPDKLASNFNYRIGLDQRNSLQCTVDGKSVSIERGTQVFYAVDDSPMQSIRLKTCPVGPSETPQSKWDALVSK